VTNDFNFVIKTFNRSAINSQFEIFEGILLMVSHEEAV